MTEKLFERDAYLRTFSAAVVSCVPADGAYEIVLDRTAFYPEGGGQPGDTGVLGGVRVTDTSARGDEVVHLCAGALTPGARVTGEIDWDRRFDHMQQHSGEHIVSGLICGAYGCSNVGFHLGAETVVIDFDRPIPPEDLPAIERRANEAVWEDRPFLVSYPTPAELAALDYRSKKELSGRVRIVECPGADRCACCGTHVRGAGEIGLVKLLSSRPFRSGVRIEMLAGRRAYDFVCAVTAQNGRVSNLLSVPPAQTADAVQRQGEELAAARYRAVGLENRLFTLYAGSLAGAGDVLLFVDDLAPDAVRRCCETVGEACGGRCAVFSGDDGTGYRYALRLPEGDLRAAVGAMNEALRGRGGGRPPLAQGSVAAPRAEIEAYFGK